MSIEYVNAQWNPFTGCRHNQAECPTANTCWARAMSKRFKQVCGGDFEPRWHPQRFALPYTWKQSRRVATCFMGDLFGAWNDGDEDMFHLLFVVRDNPQHQFLFLTKNPAALAYYNPWPANAWVGMSITGAETPQRQAEMLGALHRVEGAGVRWISDEPALGPLAFSYPDWLDWVVVGAQTGKGAKPLDVTWLSDPPFDGQAYWQKNNLARYLNRPLIQELPTP